MAIGMNAGIAAPSLSLRFWLGRCLGLVGVLLAASAVIFAVLDILPGNVAQVMLGPDADPAAVHALEVQLGLDAPAWQRYLQWLGGLLHGDLGTSQAYGVPVTGLLAERLTLTLPLTVLAMALATVMALVAGVFAALHHRRWGDVGVMTLTQLGMATPGFWLGMLLIVVFAVWLGWLPSGGFEGWSVAAGGADGGSVAGAGEAAGGGAAYAGAAHAGTGGGWLAGLWHGLQFLLLPALALACVQGAILARFVRASLLEVQGEAFTRTALAKGLNHRQVLWRHVARNAAVPVLTVAGMQFAELLSGAVVIENVFSLPGLGRLMAQSIANRDLLVVRNGVLLLVAMVVVINFIVDALAVLIDPRLRGR